MCNINAENSNDVWQRLGMGMGRHGNGLHGSAKEWDSENPFPAISTMQRSLLLLCEAVMSHEGENRYALTRFFIKVGADHMSDGRLLP